MAVDLYLKLDGVKGESPKDGHTDEIDILSFTFGATQTGGFSGSTGTGGGTGKADFGDLNITKGVDKSSPTLFQFCANGKHIASAKLTAQKVSGGTPVTYYVIELTDVMISGVHNQGAASDNQIVESFSLNFAKVKFSYTPQDNTGAGGGQVSMGYDTVSGKAIS